jgi:hypothetical protein
MKAIKYLLSITLMIYLIAGCKREAFTDTSFANTAATPGNLSVMFSITQDNTGLVTITPNGEGAVSYDVYFGDATTTPVNLKAGKNVTHVYAEGVYTVKVVATNINGQTTEISKQLTVSFRAPENLQVTVNVTNLSVSLSASALYETFFKVYYGDSTTSNPEPFTQFLEGQNVSHTYLHSGTYIVRVVALSGGAATTQFLDTIHVANQVDLPVTFDDANTDYALTDFGGNQSALAGDPVTAGNMVMKVVKTGGAEVWAGTTIGGALGFIHAVPFAGNRTKMSLRVYSPAVGKDIKLKVEDHNDATHSVETDVVTTLANQWETLTFDFSHPASGTAAIDYTYTYDKASVFFDFGNAGAGDTYYCDDLVMLSPSLSQIDLPVTFESSSVDYTMTDFGGNATVDAMDPASSSNHVKKSTKTSGAQIWAGTTIGTASGFATVIPLTATAQKMSVKVYSPAAGIDVKLKVEDHNNAAVAVETDVLTTVANQWETLVFDFSNPASGTPAWSSSATYDKASVFFDFGNAGDGRVYYWDDVQMYVPVLSQIDLPVTFESATVDYTMTDFGGNATADALDPLNSSNHVKMSTKTTGAQTWAGTTIGTPAGFATVIPVSATRTKMTVAVYSPAAGIDVKLKLEDHNDATHSVETDVLTTVANQWEVLTFDFTNNSSGTPALNLSYTYDKASVFFDFGNTGDNRVYYWDNIIFL